MSVERKGGRKLKREIIELLRSQDLDQALEGLCQLPARQVINPLISLLPSTARVVMRRLMWQLNEESGGIGWGCPEAMGEIMACHQGLAEEYAHMLISYVRKDGVFLDYEPLQRGAVWGLGRLGQERPHLLEDAVPHLATLLEAGDATLRGLAAWAIGMIGAHEARSRIAPLLRDDTEVEVYLDRKLRVCRVRDLAEEALREMEP
jgi:hypothetical protein